LSSTVKINSLAKIRERNVTLQKEMEQSQQAVLTSLSPTREAAKSFVIKDVVLPAAGIALAAFALAKIFGLGFGGNDDTSTSQAASPPSASTPKVVKTTAPPASSKSAPSSGKSFGSSLLQIGQLLIPAGKAIFEIVQEEKKKQNR
jgi:hypothetical protein